MSAIPQAWLSPQSAESAYSPTHVNQHKRAVHLDKAIMTPMTCDRGSQPQLFWWATGGGGLQHSTGTSSAWAAECLEAQQGQQNHGANVHKAENRVAHRDRRNAGCITVVDIDVAAVGALLDDRCS